MRRRREGNALIACAGSPRLATEGALAAAEEGPAREQAAKTARRLRRANREAGAGWDDAMEAPSGPRLRSAVPSLALLRDLQCALAAARKAELQCVVEDAVAEQRRSTVQSIRAARRERLSRGAWARYGGGRGLRAAPAAGTAAPPGAARRGGCESPAGASAVGPWPESPLAAQSVLSGASDAGPPGTGARPRTPAGTLRPAGAPRGTADAPAWSRSDGRRAVPLLRPRSAASPRGPAPPADPHTRRFGASQRPATASARATALGVSRSPDVPGSSGAQTDALSSPGCGGPAGDARPAQGGRWDAPSPPPSARPSLSSPRNRAACRGQRAPSRADGRHHQTLPSPVETGAASVLGPDEGVCPSEQPHAVRDADADARAEQRLRRALSGIPAEVLGCLQEQPSKRLQAIHATSSASGASSAAWQSMLRREPERELAGALLRHGSWRRPASAQRAASSDTWGREAALGETRWSLPATAAAAAASGTAAAAVVGHREAALAGLEAAVDAAQAAYSRRVQAQVRASGARYELSQADCPQNQKRAEAALVAAEAACASAAADAAETLADALSQAESVLDPRGLPPTAQTLPIGMDMRGMVLTSPSLIERVRCDSLRRADAARAEAATLRGEASPSRRRTARRPPRRDAPTRQREAAGRRGSASGPAAELAWGEGKADPGEAPDLDITSGTLEAATRSLGPYRPPPSSARPGKEGPPAALGAGWRTKAARRRGSAFSPAAYCAGQEGVLASDRLPALADCADASGDSGDSSS